MNLVENFSMIEGKQRDIRELAMAKTEISEHFNTPKISSSVSFNSLAKVKGRTRTKSPLVHDRSHDYSNVMNPPTNQMTGKFKQGINAPKISKKLPPAFGTIFQKTASKLTRYSNWLKCVNKVRQSNFAPIVDNTEPLQAIEHMVEVQEYKQTAGLLTPLKHKNTKSNVDDPQKLVQKKHESKRNKNPLLPLKNYLLLSKLNEDRTETNNISLEKLDKLYKAAKDNLVAKKDYLPNIDIKPNEMVTLSVIKSSHETGTVKKLLHAPTLRLFAVKEVPISTRDARNNLKEWLSQWQTHFDESKHHIKVHSTAFNSPEGCLSIYMELLNAGSLHNLLESVGSLPETIIKSVALQMLTALDDMHNKASTVYGALSPSQILLDKDGNVKLSLGLSNRIQTAVMNNNGTLNRNVIDRTALYELTPMNNPSSFQKHLAVNKDGADNRHLQFSQDVFEFGYLMLVCAIGGLEFYESSDFADKLKLFLEELSKKPQERQKYCCIIHNEELISSIKNIDTNLFNNKPVRVQKGNGLVLEKNSKSLPQISIQDALLAQNFSKDFVKFLCSCLKFDPNERSSISSLLSSPFILHQTAKGPGVTLPELLKIGIQWNKNLVLPQEYQGPSERQLHKLCEALAVVLPNCEAFAKASGGWSPYDDLNVGNPVIQNLAFELGLPVAKVCAQIEETVRELREM